MPLTKSISPFTRLKKKIFPRNLSIALANLRQNAILSSFALIGVAVMNYVMDEQIMEQREVRDILLMLTASVFFASFYSEYVKKHANFFNFLFITPHLIFSLIYTFLHHFTIIDTATMIISQFYVCIYFNSKRNLSLYLISSFVAASILLEIHPPTEISANYIRGSMFIAFILAYNSSAWRITQQERVVRSQKSLRLKDAWFKSVFDNAPMGVVIFNDKLQPVLVNQCFINTFGYQKEEITGRLIMSLVHPEDGKLPEYKRAFAEPDKYKFQTEGRMFTKCGKTLTMQVSMTVVESDDMRYSAVTYSDITKERQINVQLQEKAKQLRAYNKHWRSSVMSLPTICKSLCV